MSTQPIDKEPNLEWLPKLIDEVFMPNSEDTAIRRYNTKKKKLRAAITSKINELEKAARLDELHRADGFTDADYTIKRLEELRG